MIELSKEVRKFSNDELYLVINAFVYFTKNHPYDWFEQCFEGWEVAHFRAKWNMYAKQSNDDTAAAFLTLWCNMDDEHRHKFVKYLMKNYSAFQKIC